jgi:hypothetical protein
LFRFGFICQLNSHAVISNAFAAGNNRNTRGMHPLALITISCNNQLITTRVPKVRAPKASPVYVRMCMRADTCGSAACWIYPAPPCVPCKMFAPLTVRRVITFHPLLAQAITLLHQRYIKLLPAAAAGEREESRYRNQFTCARSASAGKSPRNRNQLPVIPLSP